MTPDHASLPLSVIRQMVYRSEVASKGEERAMEHTFVLANHAAEDAARLVLETVDLGLTVKMEEYCWQYWCRILGKYDTTVPTGQRVGKRWCRTDARGHRWIGEYTETAILWREVLLTEQGVTQ